MNNENWKRSIGSLILGGLVSAGAQAPGFDPGSYWRLPLAPQGAAPAGWTAVETSLAPQDCGQCHPDQLAKWRTSLHARAFSPGLAGQLLAFDPAETAECLTCHAPLAEQRSSFEAERAKAQAPEFHGLAAAGNACAGCHVRRHRRFGPPQRGTGATGPSAAGAPHGGVFRTAFFESSQFCSGCHQFAPDLAVNGKPLQNTYAEWEASPQAAQGATCQTCHMPDREHSWRGIHDPAMVARGLTPRMGADGERVRFELTNTGVGHAFPTYATPMAVMSAVALDPSGAPRLETQTSHVIARRVRFAAEGWIELADTRLLPGKTAAIELAWNGSDRIRTWLEVVPDHYYETEVYPALLQSLPQDGVAARLIAEAKEAAGRSRFRLFETELRRPSPDAGKP